MRTCCRFLLAALTRCRVTANKACWTHSVSRCYLKRRPANDYQNYETGHSVLQRSHFVGEVRGWAGGLAEGCRDALVLWGNVLVDGHNRFGICQTHGLLFQTVQNTRFHRRRAPVTELEAENERLRQQVKALQDLLAEAA